VRALAVLGDGATLASGSWDRSVRLWDVATRACVATLGGHTGDVNGLAVLGDGRLASGSDDKTVRLWDVSTRGCVGVLCGHTDAVRVLAALSDGRLASGSDDGTVRVWDTRIGGGGGGGGDGGERAAPRAGSVVLEGHASYVIALAPLPGGRLASGSWDGTVRVWHVPVAL